jgi:hypothetical protein
MAVSTPPVCCGTPIVLGRGRGEISRLLALAKTGLTVSEKVVAEL